jgi:hypothetical protein
MALPWALKMVSDLGSRGYELIDDPPDECADAIETIKSHGIEIVGYWHKHGNTFALARDGYLMQVSSLLPF